MWYLDVKDCYMSWEKRVESLNRLNMLTFIVNLSGRNKGQLIANLSCQVSSPPNLLETSFDAGSRYLTCLLQH